MGALYLNSAGQALIDGAGDAVCCCCPAGVDGQISDEPTICTDTCFVGPWLGDTAPMKITGCTMDTTQYHLIPYGLTYHKVIGTITIAVYAGAGDCSGSPTDTRTLDLYLLVFCESDPPTGGLCVCSGGTYNVVITTLDVDDFGDLFTVFAATGDAPDGYVSGGDLPKTIDNAFVDCSGLSGGIVGHGGSVIISAGVALWTPALLSTLLAWWRAEDLSDLLSDGDYITSLDDASGNGYTLTASGNQRPLYKDTGAFPLIRFTNDDRLHVSSIGIGAFDIYMPFSGSSSTANLLYEHSSNCNTYDGFYLTKSNGYTLRSYKGGVMNLKALSANWGSDGVWRIANHRYDGTNTGHKLWLNGVAQSLSTANTGSPGTATTTTSFNWGAREATNTGGIFDSPELLLLPSVASSHDREAVEGYMSWKYSIPLPAGHTYKDRPPFADD
ncbi:MAG: hypothetical protein BIFFINMI_03564 [Phycisphaerae bacterium]|nr:hypothetical protein [Phycisphaerae bacterium]